MSINRRQSTGLSFPFCSAIGGIKDAAIGATTPSLRRRNKKYRVEVEDGCRGVIFNEIILSSPRITTIGANKDSVVITHDPPTVFIYKIDPFKLKLAGFLVMPCFATVFCV